MCLPEPSEASLACQARLRHWLRVGDHAARDPAPLFLLVTPLGMPGRVRLREALGELGIERLGRQSIPCFARAAMAVYARHSDRQSALRALAYERAWRELAGPWGDEGELWRLSPLAHGRLLESKRELRRRLGLEVPFWLREGTRWQPVSLHAFHVPDPGQRASEWARLHSAVASAPAAWVQRRGGAS